jgi:hypothetical protein
MQDFACASHISRRTLQENCPKQPLTYFSGFWALVTLLFLNSAPACAEWQAVEKDYLYQDSRLCTSIQTAFVEK